MQQKPGKVLIIRYGAIGDVIHTTNTFRAIKNAYPDCEIHFMTFKCPAQLLLDDSDLDRVIITEKSELKPFGQRKLISLLKSENYNLIINLQPNFNTRLLLFRAGCKSVSEYQKDYKLHAVINFWQTARKKIEDIKCPSFLSIQTRANIDNSIKNKYVDYPRPFIAINAGGTNSPRQGRCYPINKWLHLGIRLQKQFDGTVFLTGLEEDKIILSDLDNIPNSVNLIGKLSLPELASLYKNCDLLLSGDSGPLHIATAVGTRVLGLFGSMMISRTGPYGTGHKTIKSSSPCAPCNRRKCKINKYRKEPYQLCMQSISVEDIFLQACEILNEREKTDA